uniref:DUF4168 domain-containing protein n=1 Tax=Leptocylindrus danicus TaxID=163516 RepID=A0A7S2JZP0_9STRA
MHLVRFLCAAALVILHADASSTTGDASVSVPAQKLRSDDCTQRGNDGHSKTALGLHNMLKFPLVAQCHGFIMRGGGASDDAASAVVGGAVVDVSAGKQTEKASKVVDATSSDLRKPVKGMPSLFHPEEAVYDRYAACLAATESLRQTRDAIILRGADRDSSNPVKRILKASRFTLSGNPNLERDSMEFQRANTQYLVNSGKIIRALGLSVTQFNKIGREVSKDEVLKERVTEQAYLYRLAASLNMDKIPLIEDSQSQELLKAHRRKRIQMFARSMAEIEDLRTSQTQRLMNACNVERLPDGINICDPQVLPLLSPKVRAVCDAFPLQAEDVIKKYGLNSDEFNNMLEEAHRNPVFRWRVKKYMSKTSEEASSP